MTATYCVFWVDDHLTPSCEIHSDLSIAVAACEYHRSNGHKFVTMAVSNDDMVGKMGVGETDDTYNWSKRRDSISARRKGI